MEGSIGSGEKTSISSSPHQRGNWDDDIKMQFFEFACIDLTIIAWALNDHHVGNLAQHGSRTLAFVALKM